MDDKQDHERIKQQQVFERKRLQRGRTILDRGRTILDRGRTILDRGRTILKRGAGVRHVTGEDAAADIFRRAASLGGHLVVAFVAPVSASSGSSRSLPDDDSSGAAALAAVAQEQLSDDPEGTTEQRKQKANAPLQSATLGSNDAPARTGVETSNKAWQ
jgi:hypothetical protein